MPNYDDILSMLTSQQDKKRNIRLLELRKDIEAENVRFEAYCDGAYDAVKAIKQSVEVERKKDNAANND